MHCGNNADRQLVMANMYVLVALVQMNLLVFASICFIYDVMAIQNVDCYLLKVSWLRLDAVAKAKNKYGRCAVRSWMLLACTTHYGMHQELRR